MMIRILALALVIVAQGSVAFARTIVISDIDDTIQHTQMKPAPGQSRVAHAAQLARNVMKNHDAFTGMAPLYSFLAARGVEFHYVTGAPLVISRLPMKFLESANFPVGGLHVRPNLDVDTEVYKFERIAQLMTENPDADFVLIGDNGERDVTAYDRVRRDPRFTSRISAVYIHDLYPVPTGMALTAGQEPYFTAADLALRLVEDDLINAREAHVVIRMVEQGLSSQHRNIQSRAFPHFGTISSESFQGLARMITTIRNDETRRSYTEILRRLSRP